MKEIKALCRQNIWNLPTYTAVESEHSEQQDMLLLNANENPYNKPFNRYPTPQQQELKLLISSVKGIPAANIFLCNGSNEAIDMTFRIFCEPGVDNVVAISPTYDMYRRCAELNNIDYRSVLLDEHYQTTADNLLDACNEHTKLICICSPNNPTGNTIDHTVIKQVLYSFQGIVIIDEAYIDFANSPSFVKELAQYPNLIVLNTMSHAWGLAAIRLGMVFADKPIIDLFNKVAMPYNINALTQQQAIEALKDPFETAKRVSLIQQERARMLSAFQALPCCKKVYPTEANFFLAQMIDAQAIYDYLLHQGIAVHNCAHIEHCENCLRITIGTKTENQALLAALRKL